MERRLRKMIGHGAIVTILGLVAGFGIVTSLIGGFEIWPGYIIEFTTPGDSAAWARAHAGGLMNGILIFVGAMLLHTMNAPEGLSKHIPWMLIAMGYANTAFYWFGMFATNRALSFGDNPIGEANLAGFLGFFPAFVMAFVTIVAMGMLARYAFSQNDDI